MAKYKVTIIYNAGYEVNVIAKDKKEAEKIAGDSFSVSFGRLENNETFCGAEKLYVTARSIRVEAIK